MPIDLLENVGALENLFSFSLPTSDVASGEHSIALKTTSANAASASP